MKLEQFPVVKLNGCFAVVYHELKTCAALNPSFHVARPINVCYCFATCCSRLSIATCARENNKMIVPAWISPLVSCCLYNKRIRECTNRERERENFFRFKKKFSVFKRDRSCTVILMYQRIIDYFAGENERKIVSFERLIFVEIEFKNSSITSL